MKKLVKIMISVFVALVVIGGGRFFYLGSQSANMNPKLGIFDQRLTPCPNKPNCVSSFEDGEHYIDPIETNLDIANVHDEVMKLSNVKLVSKSNDYIHFTFSSSVFNFVDDLELYKVDEKLHIRGSSRVGHSDLGANKKRVEKIRNILNN